MQCLHYLILLTFIFGSQSENDYIFDKDDLIHCETGLPADSNQRNCTTQGGNTIMCFGGIANLPEIDTRRLLQCEELNITCYSNTTFDPKQTLMMVPKIKRLLIEHSDLTFISNDFPKMNHLESINISWTQLAYMRSTLFMKLPNLKELDLRWNQLDHMESNLLLPETFESLYLGGNPWNCSGNLKWLINETLSQHVVDKETLSCSKVDLYPERNVLKVMMHKKILKEKCLHPEIRNCTCALSFLRIDGMPINLLNCSNRNFISFPTYLPENVTILHLQHNKISDISSLATNYSLYKNVYEIYLDYNQIEAIDDLESYVWLQQFRTFSVRGNKLKKLPLYALRNALEKNHFAGKLLLSHNPWQCDCSFVPKFQEILQKYHNIIKDVAKIECKYIEGDNLFTRKLLSLKRTEVCKIPATNKIHPLDLLNGILATLIVIILSKLGYDYYRYRRYGKVPWIVSKMP